MKVIGVYNVVNRGVYSPFKDYTVSQVFWCRMAAFKKKKLGEKILKKSLPGCPLYWSWSEGGFYSRNGFDALEGYVWRYPHLMAAEFLKCLEKKSFILDVFIVYLCGECSCSWNGFCVFLQISSICTLSFCAVLNENKRFCV